MAVLATATRWISRDGADSSVIRIPKLWVADRYLPGHKVLLQLHADGSITISPEQGEG